MSRNGLHRGLFEGGAYFLESSSVVGLILGGLSKGKGVNESLQHFHLLHFPLFLSPVFFPHFLINALVFLIL